ncbi:MAG: AAA family ATPase [Deltaproteobacteria bacterium]|nr:AAA family ATPase [Deltaproteobacteria bacterium]
MLVFNGFRLDVANASLRHGKRTILLTPKAFNALRYLAEHAGQLVSKDELWAAVWPGISVTDASLTMCVSEIRKALGDDPRTPHYIETVHRLGYRFIAPVSNQPVPAADSGLNPPGADVVAGVRTVASHFVEREAELAQLHEWLRQALCGKAHIVFVTGEPGIGKTALVEEFLRQEQLADESLWIGRGQCIDHYGAGEAYLPVLDAIGRLCREPGGGRLLKLLDKHAPAWLAQMPGLLDSAEWKALQGRIASTTRERMLRELTDATEAISRERPLVLWFEDLHWSDYSTLEWLGFLGRRQDPARLLVLGTYRPVEVIVRAHPLKDLKQELQIHGLSKELPVSLLNEPAVMEYLTLRLAASDSFNLDHRERLPADESQRMLAHMLYQRTDGNPLFMVNLVDYLTQQKVRKTLGKAIGSSPGAALTDKDIEPPPSLVLMVEHNMERLPPEEQAMLEGASVVGAEFGSAAVAAALQRPVTEVETYCGRLARQQQFIESLGAGELPDGTVTARFRFRHGLYRDVLYERVAPNWRVELHRRIAEREEQAYKENPENVAVELAYHYRLGGNRIKTVKYLELAAERATARRAYHEAEQHYRDAIETLCALPQSPERLRQELSLLLALGSTMGATHGVSAAETTQVYRRARSLADDAGSADSSPLLWGLSVAAMGRGELRAALPMTRQLLEIGRSAPNSPGQFLAHTQYGCAYYFLGNLIGARKHLLKANETYRGDDLHALPFTPAIIRLVMSGVTEWHLGYPERALHCAEEMVALARRSSDPMSLCMAYFNASQLYHLTRDWDRMLKATEQSQQMSAAARFPLNSAAGKIHLAYSRAQLGDTSGAAEQMLDGLSELAAMKWYVTRRMFFGWLTKVYMLTGDFKQARKCIEETLEFTVEEMVFQPELLRLRGEVRLFDDDCNGDTLEKAEQDFRAAIGAARRMSAKSDELRNDKPRTAARAAGPQR